MTISAISGARIAILGAGGQIGRGLVETLHADCRLDLFTERPERLAQRLNGRFTDRQVIEISHTEAFGHDEYDLIVNAALPGDPNIIRSMGAKILQASETVDNMVLHYLDWQPRCKLLFLSTGAIYGNAYERAADRGDALAIMVNQPEQIPYYPISKIVAEAKHRARRAYAILDVRVFGYLSGELPLGGGFFLSEIASSLLSGTPLRSNRQNFLRDFVGPLEIANCVRYALSTPAFNRAIDLVSPEAISKKGILALASERLGLRYTVSDGDIIDQDKPGWPRQLSILAMDMPGFEPVRPSSEVIIDELSRCLKQQRKSNGEAIPRDGEIAAGARYG